MDPIEQMRQQVCEELHGSVTVVGKFLVYMASKRLYFLHGFAYYAFTFLIYISVIN